MTRHVFSIGLLLIILMVSCKEKSSQHTEAEDITIFPTGDKITNKNFNGTAYLHMMVSPDSLNPTAVGNVTFEPGARTIWHYHPGGQILFATAGVGYYQEEGKPKQILRKGDYIKCPPNIPHWHGASPDISFVQIAVTNNQYGPTVWLNEVSDDEYKSKK